MADYNSSLPIRTETDGDVVAKLAGLTTANIAEVNASNEQLVKDADVETAVGLVETAVGGVTTAVGLVETAVNNVETAVNAVETNQTDGTQKTQVVDGAGDILAVNTDGSINVNVVASALGDQIHKYDTAPTIAPNTPTTVIDYTVTVGKTFLLKAISGTASGKVKVVLKTGLAGATTQGTYFNSTSAPNVLVEFPSPIEVVAGHKIQIIITNRDNSSSDLYATINGQEV